MIDNSEGRAATEFSELAIERRLDRSGDGVYRLNGARCRLADVTDVLSDTNLGREMHSVISQGRVEKIVHSKPRERRLLVEEAAGLGKHRKRRRRAELKLAAARDNLDRALDVEREARGRLRPLKRQAQAAELGARIEREELGLRGRLVSEELRFGADRAAAAAKAAEQARAARDGLEQRLAEVGKRRREAEERFAARDRERTQAWGLLTKLRGESERIAVRVAGLSGRETEIEAGPRAPAGRARPADPRPRPRQRPRRARPQARRTSWPRSTPACARRVRASRWPARTTPPSRRGRRRWATFAPAPSAPRATPAAPRGCWASATARRCGAASPPARSCSTTFAPRWPRSKASAPRFAPGSSGPSARSSAARTTAMRSPRSCAPARNRSSSCRAQMKAASEELTKAEVEAAHLGDRRAEAERELASIGERLGEEVPAAEAALGEEERAEIDRRLERLERRRAQIGPVNPLAEREYDEAREHVESLQAQREDTERAMRELESLIRDIDEEIERAFEQTFEATAKNFEEMVEHLFPGGRGKLRRVSLAPVRAVEAAAAARSGARRAGGRRARGGRGGARRTRRRDRGHPGRQVDPQALAALRRREVAGRPRLRLRGLPRPALPLLHPRRGRGRPRRRQHRPLPAAGPPLLRPRPVRHRHPPETDHGRRRRALRRQHGRRRHHQGRLPPAAARRRRRRRRRGRGRPEALGRCLGPIPVGVSLNFSRIGAGQPGGRRSTRWTRSGSCFTWWWEKRSGVRPAAVWVWSRSASRDWVAAVR